MIFQNLGHEQVRNLWKDFLIQADAIVFLVDSADPERIPEAKEELHHLLEDPVLTQKPFLILANKIDIPVSYDFACLYISFL